MSELDTRAGLMAALHIAALRHQAAMDRCAAACLAGNWEEAERFRQEAVACIESYLDNMIALFRRSHP